MSWQGDYGKVTVSTGYGLGPETIASLGEDFHQAIEVLACIRRRVVRQREFVVGVLVQFVLRFVVDERAPQRRLAEDYRRVELVMGELVDEHVLRETLVEHLDTGIRLPLLVPVGDQLLEQLQIDRWQGRTHQSRRDLLHANHTTLIDIACGTPDSNQSDNRSGSSWTRKNSRGKREV
ncbi:hypothetical protein PMAYCL1PPCAC_33425 [Pristionchus mayeri]|uniref:Uncharacterized protein n=1 Tax=Pristionchus mayeri TaxID=1317129 RepID=A0AAN5DHR1_9BILA|nr:hypothetical protein PMAYCL1PPCAC_19918 [Pristionchus mayeri]GMR63230.1 hypothetical protein PMAYCL1PPCAC_33425 [Pristionchus mayeri]